LGDKSSSADKGRKGNKTYTSNSRLYRMRKDELKKNNFYMTYDNYNDRVKSSK